MNIHKRIRSSYAYGRIKYVRGIKPHSLGNKPTDTCQGFERYFSHG